MDDPQDRTEFGISMYAMAEAFDTNISTDKISVFFEALIDYHINSIAVACTWLIRNHNPQLSSYKTNFPVPAQIIEAMRYATPITYNNKQLEYKKEVEPEISEEEIMYRQFWLNYWAYLLSTSTRGFHQGFINYAGSGRLKRKYPNITTKEAKKIIRKYGKPIHWQVSTDEN